MLPYCRHQGIAVTALQRAGAGAAFGKQQDSVTDR